MFGFQYRPSFFINIYNRLQSLDFSDEYSYEETKNISREIDELSAINKMALISECPPRNNEDGIDNDDDSEFSFTDIDDINKEINSFL